MDELVSAPYVVLTTGLMRQFGVNLEVEGKMDGGTPAFRIAADAKYASSGSILVKGDASSASYLLAGAAITGGTATVRGCGSVSIQGNAAFADESMGAMVRCAKDSITVTQEAV